MLKMTRKCTTGRVPLFLFVASAICLVFSYGVVVGRYHIFPYKVLAYAEDGFGELRAMITKEPPWYHKRVMDRDPAFLRDTGQGYKGLYLVARVTSGRELVAEIMDIDGQKLHVWHIDWFKIWPDAGHVPEQELPRARPGTHIHGAVLMENGDLVFNFEHLGLVRLDRRGEVVWRLPYQTHHTVHRHDDGNLWVCGQKYYSEPDARFPNRNPPFYEYTLLEVTPDGGIVEEWSVDDLLHENGLAGLFYLGNVSDWFRQADGDLLHLNDVEPFPATMEGDFITQGDILVSLRNINTVFVFNRHSRKVKFITTGWFVGQHDPDFIDGNRFSVFDNNNIAHEGHGQQSRIVIVSARDNTSEVFFEGNLKAPFYTDTLGKHQWLQNGNLLITESRQGRAFEINRRGEVVWEYVNYVDRGVVGLVEEVQRLPLEYRRLFGNIESAESSSSSLRYNKPESRPK
jgi:hypothetical protein